MITRRQFPFNYDADQASLDSSLSCADSPSFTQQQFKEECDINHLVARFGLTGTMPQNPDVPAYQDFEDIFDFHTAQNAVTHARQQFEALPSRLRSRFNHSPQALLTFLADPANRDEAVALGLVKGPIDPLTNPGVPPATPPAAPSQSPL